MSVVDEIKGRLDIVEVVGAYVSLQKAGRNWRALCPFHGEKTPSFYVFPDSQRWHCFGACGEGGDVFSFTMKREGWDFGTSLQELARRAGVELTPRTPAQVQADEQTDRLRSAAAEAALYYHQLLLHAPQAAQARAYLDRRGLTAETIARFQLGYSLPGWESLRTVLLERGWTAEELVHAGLLVARDDGTAYDRFRERLMIPIRDSRGQPVGFGARTLDPEGAPKYVNSPQNPLFDKGRTLFGLDLAREAIRQEDRAVIVEGYMDVMQAHQAGFCNVVAQMGTALTEAQVRLLERSTRRFVLALDPDAAGVQATLRGMEVVRESLDREWAPVFDPRGLVGFEGRLGAEIRILSLPPHYDPDDLIRSDRERWIALVQEALPVVEFYMQTLLAGANIADAKERARVVEAMLPLLRDVADGVERETYAQKLARVLHVEARTVVERLRTAERRAARRAVQAPTPARREVAKADLEGYCLAMFLARPQLLAQVDGVLEDVSLPRLRAQDFADPAYRAAFQSWAERDPGQAPDQVAEWLPETVAERLATLPPIQEEMADEQWLREGVQAALRLRERNLRQKGAELRSLIGEIELTDRQEEVDYGQALRETGQAILQLQQALRACRWVVTTPIENAGGTEGIQDEPRR